MTDLRGLHREIAVNMGVTVVLCIYILCIVYVVHEYGSRSYNESFTLLTDIWVGL